jgi:aspartate/methionine/tyrosine aminotransferase
VIPAEYRLERFFARWEFTVDHLLCASDVDGLAMSELLELADHHARELWDRLTLGYTETTGHSVLRDAIAEQYDKVTADDIVVCGGGAVEALFLLWNTILGPGDHSVVVWPAFEPLWKVTAAIGAGVTMVRLDAADGWRLDIDEVRRALRPDTRAIVVNYPHNPTGAVLDLPTYRALVELADERGIRLVSDEVYRLMEFDPAARLPAAADMSERAVSVGVMSKAYGLAGLRIGWVAARDPELRRAVVSLKDYTSVCASAPAEVLSTIALRARERVVGRCRRIVADNLAHVDEFFARWLDLFEWVRPAGGTTGFPRLTADWPIEEFVADLVHDKGVLLLPGTIFDDTGNRFRIGFGRQSVPEALHRLDEFLSESLSVR